MIKPLVMIALGCGALAAMLPDRREEPARPVSAVVRAPGEPVRLERAEDGHFYVHGEVDGQLARFLVDTGATSVALTVEDAARLGVDFSPANFTVVGMGASGPVRGQEVTLGKIVVEGREAHEVQGVVLEGLEISLLGQSFLSRIGSIEMASDYMVLR